MFGYYPFYHDYYYRPIRVYNPFDSMTRYINHLERRMNSIFSDIFENEFYNMIESKPTTNDNDNNNDNNKKEENSKESEFSKEVKETQEKILQNESKDYSKTSYLTEHNYCYNGRDKFEEIREKTSDGDKTYISKIKRIGNRWVQIDEIIDKEGKKTTKETWHNVSEDEIDSFENEWDLRNGIVNESKEVPQIKNEENKEE